MDLRPVLAAALAGALALGGCGGDGESGEPLLGGSLTGEYDGISFSPEFGFATLYQDVPLIAVGEGALRCGSEDDSEPPDGQNAVMAPPELAPGEYTSVIVQLYNYRAGDFESVGSNSGTVTLTDATAEVIAGSVEYDFTDDEGRHFALSGSFEVVNCAP